MKLFKKTASVLLAMSMLAMLSTTAFADNTEGDGTDTSASIQVDVSKHTYTAYQIFKAENQENEDNALLCDLTWNEDDIDVPKLLSKLGTIEAFKVLEVEGAIPADLTANDVAKILEKMESDSAQLRAFAALVNQCVKIGSGTDIKESTSIDGEGLEAGYYLVVDTTITADGVDTAKNLSLLQATRNTSMNITSKTAIPMVEKKVKEESFKDTNQKDVTGYTLPEGYNDVADYDIGDDVDFMLIGSMPTTIADYAKYKYVFHDTISSGLTYNEDSIVVYMDDDNDPTVKYEINPASYSVTATSFTEKDKDNTMTVSFDDVKSVVDMNGKALTIDANSKIIVEYKATLNNNAKIGLPGNPNTVYLQYSNNPNLNGDGTPSDETGNTPEDKVIVFTYELDVTKLDADNANKKLDGAEFTLQKEADGLFYNNTNNVVTWVENEDDATKLTTVDGMFSVKGIDDGTYFLHETKAPIGYNLLQSKIKVVITATTANGQSWKIFSPEQALTALAIAVDDTNANLGEANGTGDVNSGTVNMNVLNNEGSLLPETGGVGTVLIYTIGAILAVGSAVLLVTKKRMGK
ncbi:MAG: isopeptide-forming domain-containing fimbrial protein [Acutalibacteraceae bacterium]|nr:isopeptide-forming domain-containing fimbrial protein [Acutalibacteraceae bacterium]